MMGYTMLKSYKDLVALRSEESFQFGALEMESMHSDILYFTRKATGFPGYLVAINKGDTSAYSFSHIAKSLTLVYHSTNGKTGDTLNTESTPIGFTKKGEVYVFKY